LSFGGMFVQADVVPAFGAKLTIRGELGGHEVSFPAVVRWTKPTGFGVQFGLLGARDTHTLTNVIRSRR
jgi:type IV pilus assembly protein PilZ